MRVYLKSDKLDGHDQVVAAALWEMHEFALLDYRVGLRGEIRRLISFAHGVRMGSRTEPLEQFADRLHALGRRWLKHVIATRPARPFEFLRSAERRLLE